MSKMRASSASQFAGAANISIRAAISISAVHVRFFFMDDSSCKMLSSVGIPALAGLLLIQGHNHIFYRHAQLRMVNDKVNGGFSTLGYAYPLSFTDEYLNIPECATTIFPGGIAGVRLREGAC